jgi:hypothetical protein
LKILAESRYGKPHETTVLPALVLVLENSSVATAARLAIKISHKLGFLKHL